MSPASLLPGAQTSAASLAQNPTYGNVIGGPTPCVYNKKRQSANPAFS